MSHSIPLHSEPGTATVDRTVGELVAERPSRSRIFQRLQIDFCCQGGRTLRESCRAKGVDPEAVAREIDRQTAPLPEDAANPAELPPTQLADHIVARFHEPLRAELPRLRAMADRVAQVHGGGTPSLVEVRDVFHLLEEELLSHLAKEEQILFPIVREAAAGNLRFPSIDAPVACMLHEHDDAGEALRRLRTLTHDFQPPADACNTYRALFSGLAELEAELHRHIHLENAVLFPAAKALLASKAA
jgi:regulator of cell morphogenesis and NO signaling